MTFLLSLLPWFAFLGFLYLAVRLPRELPGLRSWVGNGPPLPPVSIIVPARDEARNIQRLLASLTASDYPDFEIIVLDDRSEDRTAQLAKAVARGNAKQLVVRRGDALPEGWFGKPWACHQGATLASGELLLFTDADTWHGPQLLRKAVLALKQDDAHLLSVVGRQRMESFWERVVQPQVFAGMVLRFRDQREPLAPKDWRSAIANGQFILVTREAYQEEGGHEAVRGEVVEDLRMAQRWVHQGKRVSLRAGEEDFSTRMYHSLRELVEGWSKNLYLGGLATFPDWLRPWIPPLAVLSGLFLWLLPPLVLLATVLGVGSGVAWAAGAMVLSAGTWALICTRMHIHPAWGLLYPLGAGVSTWILVRAWRRGGAVEWKGRGYSVDPEALWEEPAP